MLGKEHITSQFRDSLDSQRSSSGRKGLHVGSKSLFRTFLPLTDYLTNVLWRESDEDSTSMAAAKTAARGLTYFFTLVTAAPLYQFVFHGLPATVAIATNHTQYAKVILESLSEYNDLRHEIAKAGDHEKDYLALKHIDGREAEIDANGGIVIKLSPEEQAKAKENIRRLHRQKTECYDKILNEQVKAIVEYLRELDVDDRAIAYKEIIGAFMTHVGFDDVFIRKDERLDFALEISNRIGVSLVTAEAQSSLEELSKTYNFITFNSRLDRLTKEIAMVFGITPAVATSLVAHSMKTHVERMYGTLDRFSSHFSPHVDDVARVDSTDFRVFLDSIQNNYEAAITELEDEYENLRNGAVLKDADESLAIINREILDLRAKVHQYTSDLKTINEKLRILAHKGSRHKLKKITETKAMLYQAKRDANAAYKATLKQIEEKLKDLSKINNMKDVNFNGPRVQELKKVADEKLELERQVREAHANLGTKNKRAFRACVALFTGVKTDKPAEAQFTAVSALAVHLHDPSKSFATRAERVRSCLGLGPKTKPVALFDVTREHLNTFSLDSLQARDSVRSAYDQMTPAQKAYFAQEVARQAGKTAPFYRTASLVAFGKKYVEGYIAGDVEEVEGVKISPQTIKHIVESEPGKKAASYQPYTRFNDWYWKA